MTVQKSIVSPHDQLDGERPVHVGQADGYHAHSAVSLGRSLARLASRSRASVDPASRRRKTWPVHAVVATVRIDDPEAALEALAGLRLNVVPRAPGFVSAYWLAPIDGIGMSVIVFPVRYIMSFERNPLRPRVIQTGLFT